MWEMLTWQIPYTGYFSLQVGAGMRDMEGGDGCKGLSTGYGGGKRSWIMRLAAPDQRSTCLSGNAEYLIQSPSPM